MQVAEKLLPAFTKIACFFWLNQRIVVYFTLIIEITELQIVTKDQLLTKLEIFHVAQQNYIDL
jgi:hypothetical protein